MVRDCAVFSVFRVLFLMESGYMRIVFQHLFMFMCVVLCKASFIGKLFLHSGIYWYYFLRNIPGLWVDFLEIWNGRARIIEN